MTTLAALIIFTDWAPNEIDEGDKPAGTTPLPVNFAVWGEFEALSLTVSVPVRAPRTEGVNVTEMVQLSFTANVLGGIGQFEVWVKSPDVEIVPMVRGAV